MRNYLVRLAGRFYRDEQGAVAIMVGLMLIVLLIAGGVAVDYGFAARTQSSLAVAADSAAVSAAVAPRGRDREAEARKYFRANFPDGYLNSSTTADSIRVNVNTSQIEVRAGDTVATRFVKLDSGPQDVAVSARSVVNIPQYNKIALGLLLESDIDDGMEAPCSGTSMFACFRNGLINFANRELDKTGRQVSVTELRGNTGGEENIAFNINWTDDKTLVTNIMNTIYQRHQQGVDCKNAIPRLTAKMRQINDPDTLKVAVYAGTGNCNTVDSVRTACNELKGTGTLVYSLKGYRDGGNPDSYSRIYDCASFDPRNPGVKLFKTVSSQADVDIAYEDISTLIQKLRIVK